MKPAELIRHFFVFATAMLALSACSGPTEELPRKPGKNAYIDVSMGQLSSCGQLHVDILPAAPLPGAAAGSAHHARISRSATYSGMEDNDLRGFLDGTYKEGWNQVGQTHLRLGRRARNPGYGEYELFRNLQRWADLPVPANAELIAASLKLSLESGPPFPVDIAIYAARKDWNPGQGGTRRDNNSPPAKGEVWWLDARYEELPWATAGAGYASDNDKNADTWAQPLAFARYKPGDTELLFESERITDYVQSRLTEGAPLLLLYKLVDHHEDSIGSVLEIWSANYGVAGSRLRPELSLEWRAPEVFASLELPLQLEAGRALLLPDIATIAGGGVAASFNTSDPGSTTGIGCGQMPHIEYREVNGEWQALQAAVSTSGDSIDLRVTAAENPVELGSLIAPSIRDTWIPVGAPEEHEVLWLFTRPDGTVAEISGDYMGDYTWRAEMRADFPGRWSYQWRHSLAGKPLQSELHVIDVVARDLAPVVESLEILRREILDSGAMARSHEMLPFELRFMRLERAAMALRAEGRNSEISGETISSKIIVLRELLSGESMPRDLHPEAIRSREAEPGTN